MKLRSFERNDWNGFSGAEPFTDSAGKVHQPLINDSDAQVRDRADIYPAIVIVDATGISVEAVDDKGDELFTFSLVLDCGFFGGKLIAEKLGVELNAATLVGQGFTRFDR